LLFAFLNDRLCLSPNSSGTSNTMPKKHQINQKHESDKPCNDNDNHRIETVICLCLICWITADILVAYGHNTVATFVFYLAILFPTITLAYHARKGWRLRYQVSVGIVVLGIIAYPLLLLWASYAESFSVSSYAEMVLGQSRKEASPMWCVHLEPDGKWVDSPVYFAYYLQFVNERDEPMFIDGFSIEHRAPNGKWEPFPVIETHPEDNSEPEFYFVLFDTNNLTAEKFLQSFKHARRFRLAQDFQSNLSEKSIGPNESLGGWLLMDIPKGGWTGKWQFTITTGGKTISRPIKDFTQMKGIGVQLHHPTSLFVLMEYKDISGIPLRYYSDNQPLSNH
jgi:hypothetical protein